MKKPPEEKKISSQTQNGNNDPALFAIFNIPRITVSEIYDFMQHLSECPENQLGSY